ncbi:Lysosomal aspartic protease [Mycena venus]|uniref:Lysosomal aspartic protease n=1 Tax=Mycena venus TaxID=2733690 RepID=A0A8H7D6I7_9AGAR|nr:Lysosomal aspartic protease [Mycena venus]
MPHMPIMTLFLLLLASIFSAADPMHIPLSLARRRPLTVEDYILSAERARARYGYGDMTESSTPRGTLAQRATVSTVPLTDQQVDSSYYCTVFIGTPGQRLNLELSLASGDSWVANSSCISGCTSSMDLYDPSSSSTSTELTDGTITYGTSSVSGSIVKDIVQLGPYTVSPQVFLAVNRMTPNLVAGAASGILGLAYQGILTSEGPSFLQALLSNGQLDSGEMSFWLNRFAGTANAQAEEANGGAFTLGGTNTSLYTGEIDFLTPTGSPNGPNWVLDVTEITVGRKSVQITPGASALATFDVSSALIAGPTSDVIAIWAAVPVAIPSPSQPGFFQFPCTATIEINISFGGRLWPINPVDMNIGAVTQGSSQWAGKLVKNVYTVFLPNPFSIGFAQLSSQALGGNTGVGVSPEPSKAGSSVPIGPIVGGVVGGVVLMFIVVALCVWRMRARRANSDPVNSNFISALRPASHADPQKFEGAGPPSPIVSQGQYILASIPSPVLGRVEPPSPIRSLSTMKQEQTAAAHYYGGTHRQSDLLVRNADGLQLSPGLEHPENSPWSPYGLTSSTSVTEGIQEVYRPLYGHTGGSSPSAAKDIQGEAVDLIDPPRYQKYDEA